MKTQTFLISFLIFSFSTASLCLADSSPAAVRDIDGNELRTGTDYRVLPVIRGSGGGLITTTRNGTCPLDVAQAELEVDQGLPVNFTPFDPKKGVIRLGVDLNIKFPYIRTICRQSTVWRVDEFDGERVVSTNGVEGNPGLETLSNWFSIETYEDGYKFVFCPTVCNFCKPNCGEVSISIKNGIRRLIVGRSEEPFKGLLLEYMLEWSMESRPFRGTRDRKNAMISGAITGALASAVSSNNRDKNVMDAITGGAVATAAEFLKYLN